MQNTTKTDDQGDSRGKYRPGLMPKASDDPRCGDSMPCCDNRLADKPRMGVRVRQLYLNGECTSSISYKRTGPLTTRHARDYVLDLCGTKP